MQICLSNSRYPESTVCDICSSFFSLRKSHYLDILYLPFDLPVEIVSSTQNSKKPPDWGVGPRIGAGPRIFVFLGPQIRGPKDPRVWIWGGNFSYGVFSSS